MPLKFVFGPSGSGKSTYLYQHVIEESEKYPLKNFIVLVPEQFTMQTQKDLVSMHPRHGIMNIDVLSFARLAYRVFEKTGTKQIQVLDDEGKNLILRKIAGDYEDKLTVLKGNIKKLGYISEVKSVISEFTQYDIGEEEMDEMLDHLDEDSRLYYKLKDIRLLYEGFQDYLRERYITKEELLDVLNSQVKESELLKNSVVVLDGFTGFTPVQNRLILELMRCCKEVWVTVTMDERENPYAYKHPYQLFGLSKQMVTTLVRMAGEDHIEVEEPVCLYGYPVKRFEKNRELAFLERNIFRYGAGRYDKAVENLEIHAAGNPRQEADAVAEGIRRLVRKEQYRYRDIGVIVSDMNVYGDYLEQAFENYGIPVFMDHKRSILLNSFVEYIRSLLNMAEKNFSYESVFRFLRTNLAGFACEEVDELENYVLGLGIRGYKGWQNRWIRRSRGMEEEELDRLNHYRVQLVEKVDNLMFVLKQKRKTVRDITMAVYEFMVKENIQERLQRTEEEFQKAGELALAKEYSQVYRIIIELFDKFVELLGEEPVGLNEYCKLLDAGLEEARVGVIPPSVDQVVAGDMQRTRLKDIRALFFLGANDSFLPGALMRTGLLTEQDREKFRQADHALAAGGKEKAYVQKFYLYMNLTKPSEKLKIYYSKVSAGGKAKRPSYLIQELSRLYPKLKVQDEEARKLKEKELTEKSGVAYLIRGLQEKNLDLTWQELYTWYQKSPEWKAAVDRILRAWYYRRPEDPLSERVARELYGENFEGSITRMERYATCACAHFLAYGLRLKERPLYEFKAVDLGNVCHRALELFSKKASEAGGWTVLPEEERKKLIDASVEEAITDYGNSVLYSTARNEQMIVRMKQMLERTVWALTNQLKAGDFVPEAYELRFFGGKIDRIDICETEEQIYVKVMDYKTGSKAFDVVALYHGLQLQLMIYMDAAVEFQKKRHPDKEVIPAGVFYYRIQDPLVDKTEDKEKAERAVLKQLKPDGIIPLGTEILKHLDHNTSGESLAVPVKYNKNGSVSGYSKVVAGEDFSAMMTHAKKQMEDTRTKILNGEAGALPYKRGQESGCDYCPYRHVCGFDVKIPGYEYRDIGTMGKEEAMAAMRIEQRESENDRKGGNREWV